MDRINIDPDTGSICLTLTPPGVRDPVYEFMIKEWRASAMPDFKEYLAGAYGATLVAVNGIYTELVFHSPVKFTKLMLMV